RELARQRVGVRRDPAGRPGHAVVVEELEAPVPVAAPVAAEDLVVRPVLADDVEDVANLLARSAVRTDDRRAGGSPSEVRGSQLRGRLRGQGPELAVRRPG